MTMWTGVKGAVLCLALSLLCRRHVPSVQAASLSAPFLADIIDEPSPALSKRVHDGVDAWSLCPPHMADVDCFYAYLRVYARLRKAAEESDRVSMRNIGKRSSETSFSALFRSRRLAKMVELCPFDMLPAQCYEAIRTLYRRLQASSLNRE